MISRPTASAPWRRCRRPLVVSATVLLDGFDAECIGIPSELGELSRDPRLKGARGPILHQVYSRLPCKHAPDRNLDRRHQQVPRPQPNAVDVDDTDAVWVSDWGANAIQYVDPKTERFESFPLPDSYANVRQLAGRKAEVGGPIRGRQALHDQN